LIFIPFSAAFSNSRSREYRKFLRLIHETRVGGLILVNWSNGRTTPKAEPYALAAFLNRMQRQAKTPLLVSADFLASDHLYEVELPRSVSRRGQGAEVLGVLLRPTDWEHGDLKGLRMLPERGGVTVPVTEWQSHDAAFKRVAEVLRDKLRDWGYVSRISVNPSEAHPLQAP